MTAERIPVPDTSFAHEGHLPSFVDWAISARVEWKLRSDDKAVAEEAHKLLQDGFSYLACGGRNPLDVGGGDTILDVCDLLGLSRRRSERGGWVPGWAVSVPNEAWKQVRRMGAESLAGLAWALETAHREARGELHPLRAIALVRHFGS